MKPAALIRRVVFLGILILGGVFLLFEQLNPPYGRLILAILITGWLVFTVFLCVPVAAIAQAARNKRHAVFSHLKQAATKEVKGGTSDGQER